ncbi:MAG: hypothetical protein JHC84_04905 [Solirubrobacteraceae bacterium]|nr:hypothetical protein [Solirubrobacteraceae bacterium]
MIFLDVRGFSSFAKIAESSETAVFLKSAYTRMLDEYFPEASFFKPTGDGLLIVLDYDESNLASVVQDAVQTSLRLVDDFPTICSDDPMINFPVPEGLGIGIARGAATCLVSGDSVLDYSGRPLNLAARLMDLARPAGVVFEDSLGLGLLDAETKLAFQLHHVYVKGLAEEEPIVVHASANKTRIPEYNRYPIAKFRRVTTEPEELKFSQVRERARYFLHPLDQEPARRDDVVVHTSFPAATKSGAKSKSMYLQREFPVEYKEHQGKPYARVDYQAIIEKLESGGVKSTWSGTIVVEYSIRPEAEDQGD